jgi:hypothetical protein
MTFINNSKFGKLSRLNKIDAEAPIQKHELMKDTLVNMHKQLTSIIKNLNKGESKHYRMNEDLYKDMDKVWRTMEQHPSLR